MRAVIAACFALAGAPVHATPAPGSAPTPAGAPLPSFTLADSTDFDALRDAWGRRLDYRALREASLATVP